MNIGALATGILLGAAGTWGFRAHAAATNQPRSVVAVPTHSGERSLLGPDANLPDFARDLRRIVRSTEFARREKARAMTQAERLAYIRRRLEETDALGWSWAPQHVAELRAELEAFIQPEDAAELSKLTYDLYSEDDKTGFLNSLIVYALRRSPGVDLLEVARTVDPDYRPNLVTMALESVAGTDVFAAIEIMCDPELGLTLSEYSMNEYWKRAAKEDPRRAMLAAKNLPNFAFRAKAYAGVLEVIAGKDGLKAALELSKQVPEGAMRMSSQKELLEKATGNRLMREQLLELVQDPELSASVRKTVFYDMVHNSNWESPSSQLEWMDQHVSDLGFKVEDTCWGAPFAALARKSLEKARTEADQYTGARREAAMEGIAQALIEKGVPQARAEMEKFTGTDQDIIRRTVLSMWTAENAAEAVAYLESLGDFPDRPKATHEILSTWSRRDGAAASEWLDRQPPGPARDQGALGLASSISPYNPEGAFPWAVQIHDEKLRETAIATVSNYVRTPETARKLIEQYSASLTESQKERLLKVGE